MIDPEHIRHTSSNPFPGLRAFKGSESHLFFGREEHIKDVLQKLESNHFVAVVGTSGTGKSSLIKAGVLPAIEANSGAKKGAQWALVTITPGSTPIDTLAKVISATEAIKGEEDQQELYNKLNALMKGSPLGLVQAMRTRLPDNTRLLLLIDQFEEVFRFADEDGSREEYKRFVNLLIETVRQHDVPIYAILTLRSDFLGDCVAFEGLPEAINDGHYLVPRMTKEQMKRAITGPIDYANGKISPRLVQHITSDLGSNPDQLPILQHAMMRCWDYWKRHEALGEPMDIKHFEAIGDLDNALSSHADEAFNELSGDQQSRAEKVFKCLTTKQSDSRGIRRPLSVAQLMSATQSSLQEIIECMSPFQKAGRNFVLPGLEVQITESTIFDISHESLMRGWDRLRAWVDEEMESAEFLVRLCHAAELYKRGESALWRNPELQLALDWEARQKPIYAWAALYDMNLSLALDFLKASVLAHHQERRKKTRRTRIIRVSLAIFISVISVLAAWAWYQTGIANNKTLEAQEQSEEALAQKKLADESKEEAVKASELAEQNKEIAQEQAKIAEEQAKNAETQKRIAEEQKRKAEAAAQDALNKKTLADQKSAEALLQKQKADSARYEASRLRYLATAQNLAYESAQVARDPELASLLALASYDMALANGGNVNDANLYNALQKALSQLDNKYSPVVWQHAQELLNMSIHQGELAVVDKLGNCLVLDSKTFKSMFELKSTHAATEINTAYISPDLSQVAIGMNDFSLQTQALLSGSDKSLFAGHIGLVRAVAFRSTSPTMISGGRDNRLILWNADGQQKTLNFEARVKTVAARDEDNFCLVGCENGKTYKVSFSGGVIAQFAHRANSRVEAISLSSDGALLVIGYSDGLTQLLSTEGKLMKEFTGIGSVAAVKFDSENDLLVIMTSGNLISIYKLSNLNLLPIEIVPDRPAKLFELDAQTGELFAYCTDRALRRYPTGTLWYANQLKGKVNRKLTKEEWNTFIGEDIPYLMYHPELPDNTAQQ